MARKKSKDLETSEVHENTVDFDGEAPVSIQVNPVQEVPKEPSLTLANQLEGHPKLFAEQDLEGLLVLQAKGISADFGEDGWARGHLWRAFVRKG